MRKINRRGQLKTQEMAFMLMAVVIFFILAGLFFIAVKYRDLYKQANLLSQEKTLSTLVKLADTPEFTCGKPLCIDEDKLMAMKDRKIYEEFWQLSSLYVIKVFPRQEEEKECTKENYPDCNLFKVYDKKAENEEGFSTFVSLCRQEKTEEGYWYDKCEIGKILAGREILKPEEE